MRRILVVNDDGIGAEGIVRLAAAAKNLGEVWVVGARTAVQRHVPLHYGAGKPANQAGGFPGTGVKAYSVAGTPRRLCEGGNPPPYAGQA